MNKFLHVQCSVEKCYYDKKYSWLGIAEKQWSNY